MFIFHPPTPAHELPCFLSNIPSAVLPQGLCTSCHLQLEHSLSSPSLSSPGTIMAITLTSFREKCFTVTFMGRPSPDILPKVQSQYPLCINQTPSLINFSLWHLSPNKLLLYLTQWLCPCFHPKILKTMRTGIFLCVFIVLFPNPFPNCSLFLGYSPSWVCIWISLTS